MRKACVIAYNSRKEERTAAVKVEKETAMIFKNADFFQGERGFVSGSLVTEGGKISRFLADTDSAAGRKNSHRDGEGNRYRNGDGNGDAKEVVDLDGALVIPGLVDIHTHGNSGCDFSDGSEEGLELMGRYLAMNGITTFLPTSMTLLYDRLEKAFRTAAEYIKKRPGNSARAAGIHMEGPFFSEKRKGAQNAAWLKLPDAEAVLRLNDNCGQLLRIVDAAPELKGAVDFAGVLSGICRISAAHTDATYDEAKAFYEAGASHLTHLFNAMPPLHHREPGVIGAAAEAEQVTAELICDGLHVHPAAVRLAFRMFPDRICLISDALRCCGMPDGSYELGGQEVYLSGGVARLKDGTIAGAASNLFEDLRNAIRFGIPQNEAIMAATIRPAQAAGCADLAGSLEAGKYADFIVCSRQLEIRQVYLGGVRIR